MICVIGNKFGYVGNYFLTVLAIELLAACQGIEFLRPLRTTTPLEKVYDLVRSTVKYVQL